MPHTQTSLHARYGAAAKDLPLPENTVLEHLLSHRSVRNFLPDALPEHTLPTLVAAAQSAASSSNLQTWSVVAVQSQASRDRLAELAGNQAHIRQAPLLLVWLADLSRIARIAQYKQQPADGLPYMDTYLMAVIDAALAAQNAVVAAEALGLGTVYIGALRNQPEAVAEVVGTPQGVFPVFGLVVGHPDPARPAAIKPRLPQTTVLHHERYTAPDSLEAEIGNYDAQLSDFQAGEGLPQVGWSNVVLDRLRNAKSLKGRHRLVEALRGAGFPLR